MADTASPTMTGEYIEPPPDKDAGYDPQTDTYYTTHNWGDDVELCDTLARALGALAGHPPAASAPLADTIDIDALERLFEFGPRTGNPTDHVTLTHNGYGITVFRTGHIDIVPPDSSDRDRGDTDTPLSQDRSV